MKRWLALALAMLTACAGERWSGPGAPTQSIAAGAAQVTYTGALSFDARRLNEVIQDDLARLSGAPNRRAVLDDAAFALSRYYQAQGFREAQVEFELRSESEARFTVKEGPRTSVDSFEFRGNREFSDAELAKLYDAPRVDGQMVLVETTLGEWVGKIRAAYVSRGFARAAVDDPTVTLEAEGTRAKVHVVIHEGRQVELRSVRLDGDLGEARADLEKRCEDERRAAKYYTPQLAGTIAAAVAEVLGNRGFPEARARLLDERFDGDAAVDLVYGVQTGQRVRIRDIRVSGNRRVSTELIVARLKLKPGALWRAEDERDSLTELYRSGLFSTVRLNYDGEGEERTLTVEVSEASSREFYVEPGYGSYERARIGLGWRDKDWFGTGRVVNLEGTLSELAQRAQLSLSDLHLFDSAFEGTASGFAGKRQEPSFDSSEVGAALSVTRRFGTSPDKPRVTTILTYQFRRSGVSNVDVGVSTPATQDVNISSVVFTPSYDSRDNIFVPHQGAFTQLSVEYASSVTGSQLDFVRTRWTASHFFGLAPQTVFGLSWRGGLISPFGTTTTIPLQERFFNGGENTVRAFREDELGPLDANGKPLGGEAFNVVSLELRQRLDALSDKFSPNLDAGLFVDAGNVESVANQYWHLDGVRWGPGVGLRYLLPVGPIRLDLGYNPDTRGNESPWVLHVSVGMSF